MLVEIKEELNDLDISLSLITKVIEEKTTVAPNYKTFVVVHFDRGEKQHSKAGLLINGENLLRSVLLKFFLTEKNDNFETNALL